MLPVPISHVPNGTGIPGTIQMTPVRSSNNPQAIPSRCWLTTFSVTCSLAIGWPVSIMSSPELGSGWRPSRRRGTFDGRGPSCARPHLTHRAIESGQEAPQAFELELLQTRSAGGEGLVEFSRRPAEGRPLVREAQQVAPPIRLVRVPRDEPFAFRSEER